MKKTFTVLVALLLAVAMIIGCQPATTTQSGTENAPAAQSGGSTSSSQGAASVPAADRPIKDEIIFAQGQDISTFNPSMLRLQRTYTLLNNIFDTLVMFDSDMNVQPVLAESWEWIDDVNLKFKVRENVTFHNGVHMTAEDVAFSLNFIHDEPFMVNNTTWYSDAEAVSEYEVVIHLNAPYGAAIGMLCHPAMAVTCKSYIEDPSGAFESMPVGTGPYKMKDYATGDYYTLERFDDYWGEPAKTKYLTMRVVPEAAQRTILLETGEIDAALDVPMNDVIRLQSDPNFKVWEVPSQKVYMFFLNCQSEGPTKNNLVRQAIFHALDSAAIVEASLYGHGYPATSYTVSTVTGAQDRSEDFKYDPELSKQLLAEAGYPNGCEVTVWTSAEQDRVEICQIFQDQCDQVGITLNIEIMDQATIDAKRVAGEDFGMILHFQNNMPNHIDQTFFGNLYSAANTNMGKYNNPEVDSLLQQVRSTPADKEDQLNELVTKIYDILAVDAPILPIYNNTNIVCTGGNFDGLITSRTGAYKFQNSVVYTD